MSGTSPWPVFLAVAVALASVASPRGAGAEWTTYHGGPGLAGEVGSTLPEKPVRLWRHFAGAAVSREPVSDGALIHFVTARGEAAAVSLEGKPAWSVPLEEPDPSSGGPAPQDFEAPPLCADGLVVVASRRGTVTALDAANGRKRWARSLGTTVLASPNRLGTGPGAGVILVSQTDGVVTRLGLYDGRKIWSSTVTNRSDGAPAVEGGRIYLGNCDAAVHAFSARAGVREASVPLERDGQVFSGVAAAGGVVFAGDRSGRLHAVDVSAGRVLWVNAQARGDLSGTPAVTSDRVVYASDDGKVYCVRRADGRPLWAFEAPGRPRSPAVAGDKAVFSSDGSLFLLSLGDGRLLWSAEVGDEITAPSLVGGTIVVGSREGYLMAFGGPK